LTHLARLAHEVMARCEELAKCSDHPSHLTRLCLSNAMQRAHALVGSWMEAAGMSVRVSAIGNLHGRYPGTGDATLFVGSHLDTVIDAGKYDGALGVLLGIAAVAYLEAEGITLPYAIEVVGFSDEEGVRFGVPFLGSRALARSFDPMLLTLSDDEGVSLREAIVAFGQDPSVLEKVPYASEVERGEVLGYFEAHIEQGPVLADLDAPVGVAQGIKGQSRARLSFVGQAGHAGTVPMRLRRDALAGAAEFILEVERRARATPGLVGTVGKLELPQGAINVIPGSASLTLDMRHADDDVRVQAFEGLLKRARELADDRQLQLTFQRRGEQRSVMLDKPLYRLLTRVAGGETPTLMSGAGHDAMIMAEAMPSAMLFVRSPNGVSHHPSETVREEDVARALEVTVRLLQALGGQRGG
jgi:allantoate deiminase